MLKNSECFECFAGKQPQSMLKTSHRHFYLAKKINFQLTSKSFSGDPFVDQNVMYSPGF